MLTRLATVPLLRCGRWYDSLDTAPIPGPGAMSLAPEAMIRADARSLRRQQVRVPDSGTRADLLRAAVARFASGEVHCGQLGKQDYEQFAALLWQTAGLPAVLVDRWCALLGKQLEAILAAPIPPGGADGRAQLTLVALPGNTFTCLEAVLSAAASGAAVWIRPSTREPFAALRMAGALLAEGWPGGLLGFYPCHQRALRTLVEVTDRQVVYGGADVVSLLRGRPTAVLRGPLRTCAVVPDGADPDTAAQELLHLIAADAGRFCTALRSVACLGDPAPVTSSLAAMLDALPLQPPDPELPQAAWPDQARAASIAAAIEARLDAGARLVTSRPLLTVAGGECYLSPALVRLHDPCHPLAGHEAPFPFATITAATRGEAAAMAAASDIVHRIRAHQ